jgi:heme A synthase
MILVELHGRIATTTLLYTLILALWAWWRYFRKEGVSSSYWGALVINEILFLAQGVLGAIMFLSGLRPLAGGMHILYGIVGLVGIPAIFMFTRGNEGRRAMLIYGAGLLFMAGIAIRAMMTGG